MQSQKFKYPIDFKKLQSVAQTGQLVVPVVVQDADTNTVLTLAYVNEAALERTITTGVVTFWSTSRNALWVKGSTSGNRLALHEIRINCDQNSLLFLVRPLGNGVCHKRNPQTDAYYKTCYFRSLELK